MKSYEEMTQSVLEKAQKHKASQKQRNRKYAVTFAGLCFAVLTVVHIWPDNTELPAITESSASTTEASGTQANVSNDERAVPRLTLLSAMPGGTSASEMLVDLEVSYKAEVRVRNISGLTETQLQQIALEDREYVKKIAGENALNYGYSPYKGENVFITSLSLGCLAVRFEDVGKVDRIRAAVTNNGRLHVLPRVDGCSNSAYGEVSIIDIDGESLQRTAPDDQNSGLEMYWYISMDMAYQIDASPDMDLSDISDTITITVNYTDGREENATVHMRVDSEGNVSAVLEGISVSQYRSKKGLL